MLISTWVILVAGLVFAFPMIYSRVKDHTKLEDETLYVHFIFCMVSKMICAFSGHVWTTLGTLTKLHATDNNMRSLSKKYRRMCGFIESGSSYLYLERCSTSWIYS